MGVSHTNVDRRLVSTSFACFVLDGKCCPVERTVQWTITKFSNFDTAFCRFGSLLEHRKAMGTGS